MRLYLFDAKGHEALGQAVPESLERFTRPHDEPEGGEMRVLRERRGFMVYAVPTPEGVIYRLVMEFRPPHPAWYLFSFPGLLVALLVSGLICFALARYLAAPLKRLRTATQGLASGDLSVRVGPLMTRRRDEMGGLSRDFDSMAGRLQEVIESQQRLMRDVSHELRSPLARLQAALGLARQRSAELALPELDRIERETERLDELIGESLSLTRLAAGAGMHRELVDLAAVLEGVAQDAHFEAAQRERRVMLTVHELLSVEGDPELIHRAVENVVRNAVHYTGKGTAVELALQRESGRALITVRDHGAGASEKDLGHLFDPFFRASEARDRASGGYGLGLAIARRAIEAHGGAIVAMNAAGGGLLVSIRLPLTREAIAAS
jgi:two-component system sensor histidine kinase CpxA